MHRYRQALLQMRDSFFPTDAVGLASPTRNAALPVMISFTVETDGKLPTEHPRVTQSSRLMMARLATLPTLWSTAPDIDAGNPAELGRHYSALKRQHLKRLNVFGGCCGTDDRHIEQIALACMPLHCGAT